MSAAVETIEKPAVPASLLKVPKWVEATLFESHLRLNIPNYKEISNFHAYPALAAGENYATIMLRVDIEVKLNDGESKKLSYMMKVPHDNELFKEMSKSHNIFDVESAMYLDVVPEFEEIYKEAGHEVKFGAKCYKIELPSGEDCVLLEDLSPRGFKNANRLEGLDMEHIKCVLKKLAQWHAASAVRVETRGKYPEQLTLSFFREEQRAIMGQMFEGLAKPFVASLKEYQGHEEYYDSVMKLQPSLIDEMFRCSKIDPNEFNVLNHGDCWSNNIMFQYDAFGKIKETYFVDYQVPKYGSPAQDLFYFLLSSTKYELKLKQFDYFIKFYHDNLVESLTMLKYPKKLPTLKEIHMALYKYGFWGYSTVTGVMGAVLLDPHDGASLDNFLGDSAESDAFKKDMYSNPRYRKHIEAILPWLQNRGALEL